MNLLKTLNRAIATCGGIGHLPWAQGTSASLLGVFAFLYWGHDAHTYLLITAGVVILSFIVSPLAEAGYGQKDDKRIVIDEVAGQMVSYLFIPVSLTAALWGFILFRFFDIFKPWPIKWLENNTGFLGVTADDVWAGIYALALLQGARYFLG